MHDMRSRLDAQEALIGAQSAQLLDAMATIRAQEARISELEKANRESEVRLDRKLDAMKALADMAKVHADNTQWAAIETKKIEEALLLAEEAPAGTGWTTTRKRGPRRPTTAAPISEPDPWAVGPQTPEERDQERAIKETLACKGRIRRAPESAKTGEGARDLLKRCALDLPHDHKDREALVQRTDALKEIVVDKWYLTGNRTFELQLTFSTEEDRETLIRLNEAGALKHLAAYASREKTWMQKNRSTAQYHLVQQMEKDGIPFCRDGPKIVYMPPETGLETTLTMEKIEAKSRELWETRQNARANAGERLARG
ncbi:hypothetical protein DFJ74DRAFT_775235 [Hyaloraphidium curvatum]|nr:hypothetical protein DFJ74DRAFT_775235 [Hyaloraphidium curvatum]